MTLETISVTSKVGCTREDGWAGWMDGSAFEAHG